MSRLNDLVERIINAMLRQEGESQTALNPLNLRGAPWLADPVIENGFWVPSCRAEGLAGGTHVLCLHIAEGNTLTDFIAGHPGIYSGFSPGADGNKPAVYIADVMAWAQVPSATVPMWNFIETAS
jgi:hypothetical protein